MVPGILISVGQVQGEDGNDVMIPLFVERCDACQRYEADSDAAHALRRLMKEGKSQIGLKP